MSGPYEDKTLICIDCQTGFVFTAAEQKFHSEKGFRNEPRRCPPCRQKRRSQFPGAGVKHKTPCAGCGVEAEVPFVPRLDKPVYCRTCFDKLKGPGPGP
ncbi:MAG: zinc-ribbon domain containing protein [Candidatus Brocadiae bacterium]|nr:zinc-ribbon domain containing protein [Candidatus Brocadiia bacterium]